MNATRPTRLGSIFNYYDAGLHAQPTPCRTQRDLATWLAGFAVACAAARLGVSIP